MAQTKLETITFTTGQSKEWDTSISWTLDPHHHCFNFLCSCTWL